MFSRHPNGDSEQPASGVQDRGLAWRHISVAIETILKARRQTRSPGEHRLIRKDDRELGTGADWGEGAGGDEEPVKSLLLNQLHIPPMMPKMMKLRTAPTLTFAITWLARE